MKRRKPLCCVVCDDACYQVKAVKKDGKPRKVGRCLEGSRQVFLAMLDGSFATITICACCAVDASNMLDVWRRCTIGPMEDARHDPKRARVLLEQARNVPLGVLKVRPHEHRGRSIEGGVLG